MNNAAFDLPDFESLTAGMDDQLNNVFGRGTRGRFGPGNRIGKGRRNPAPVDVATAVRRCLSPLASRAIAKNLIRIARKGDDAAAVAAAALLMKLSARQTATDE